jgi:AcrR family transcriptional regulator
VAPTATRSSSSGQDLAFRLAGHHLHRRTSDPLEAVAACGIQEYPPGWWRVALHARAKGEPRERDLVLVNAMRGSPYVVPRKDMAVFTAALVPGDEGLKALVGSQVAKEAAAAGFTPREALDRVAQAAREGLADGPLDRDAFHQAMRERLPEGLLPWCRGCKSHHVRPGFWRALGPLGVTEMPGKATYALARPPGMSLAKARAELVRRFLRCYGPATHTDLASWAQTAPAHAKALFTAIDDELEAVDGKRFILAAERKRYDSPPAARGVRLLGGYDPFVGQPDREARAPDAARRKRLFPAVGRPGVVLSDGKLAGVWRSRKNGDTLKITVDWIGESADIEAEARAVAKLRECTHLELG